MPRDNLRWEIQDAVERANEKQKMDNFESQLAMGVIMIGLVVGVIGMAFFITPVIAPILLSTTENARKRGDISSVNKWEIWSLVASTVALAVVLGIAILIGFMLAFGIIQLAQAINYTSALISVLIYLVAIVVGLIAFLLSFITGISPTAIVYLNNKESQFRTAGNIITASKVKWMNSAIRIVAIGTVVLAIISAGVVIIIGVFLMGTST